MTPWTAAYQSPPSMGFSRQEYWSGVPDQESSYHFEIRCDHVTHAGQSCGNRSDTAFQGGKKVKVKLLSRVQLFTILWTVAYQAPLSMGFSRQEYWSGLPFPSPGDLPNPGIEAESCSLQADSLLSELPEKPLPKTIPICFSF